VLIFSSLTGGGAGVFFFFSFLFGNYKCELMARRSLHEASVLDPAIIDAYSVKEDLVLLLIVVFKIQSSGISFK
jgi:hypothetical protein